MERYNLVILGGGAAAFAAATEADNLGIKTAIINTGLPMGGTCVNVGCVPTKHLLSLAKDLYTIRHPRFESIKTAPPIFNFDKAMEEKDTLIEALRKRNYEEIPSGFKHVTWLDGKGSFVSDRVIKVGDKELVRIPQVLP